MLHVITYDVSNDDTRAAVAQVLMRYGERVQESVFECSLTPAQLEEVQTRIGMMLANQADSSLRVYRLCADCAAAAAGVGDVTRAVTGDGFIVA